MGTPDFAIYSLDALRRSGEEIIGVITQSDKPKGRGHKMMMPPVKEYALEHDIPVWQPSTLRSEEFEELLHELDPEVIVVVAYGKILPRNVLNYPKFGCINVHGSLLPKYRGAAPIQRAIIDGEKFTGITTMFMNDGIDTGDMLLSAKMSISEEDNFETLHNKLGELGGDLLIETLNAIKNHTLVPIKQDDSLATFAKKIEKDDLRIDFSKNISDICNLIRGLSPFPLAYTHTPDGKILKIVSARIDTIGKDTGLEHGTVINLADSRVGISCCGGIIELLEVIPEGKGKMSAADFIRGRKLSAGDILK